MKKLLSLVLAGVMLIGLTACDSDLEGKSENDSSNKDLWNNSQTLERETNFRETAWGDSIKMVKSVETATFVNEIDDAMVYDTYISGCACKLYYFFNSDELYRGTYVIENAFSSGGQYISEYEAIKKELKNKYGSPIEDKIIKNEKDSLIEMAGPSSALKYGYTVYRAKWKTDATNIMLAMMAQNYEISIIVSYEDKYYAGENNSNIY